MKNLENYGVLEMNARELEECEGGLVFMAIFMCVVIIGGPVLAWGSGQNHHFSGQP